MSFSSLFFVLLEYIHVLFELFELFGVCLKDSLEVYKWFLLEGIAMDLVIFGGDTLSYLRFVVFAFLNCLLHLKS